MTKYNRLQEDQLVEGRLATSIARALTSRTESASHDITERLRFAREKALERARQSRLAASSGTTIVGVSAHGAGLLSGFVPWWQRAASVLPVIMLVAGFLAIDHWSVREQVLAAADFDALLLADDLPPAAYSDPGFAEFLRSPTAP